MKQDLLMALARSAFLLLIIFGGGVVSSAEFPPSEKWVLSRTLSAPEAHQAAAADEKFLYAVTNTLVAKYDRTTGERIEVSSGEPATHLNSAFFHEGRLYCAHSNYPKSPERSEIMVLDPSTMVLSRFKDFGNYGGSLTWAVHYAGHWWCNFARYGDANGETVLVQFNNQWCEVGRWKYPAVVVKELRRNSLSGGLWHDGLLAVTGHDDPIVFRLRIPSTGDQLELVERQEIPFTGQGIAFDPVTRGLFGINRVERRVILADRMPILSTPRLPRDNLLLARDGKNEGVPISTANDWQRRRVEIVRGAEMIMGRLPGREKLCPLDMQIIEEVDCGKYVRRLITYQSEPGVVLPSALESKGGNGAQGTAAKQEDGSESVTPDQPVVGTNGRALAYLCIPKEALVDGAKPVSAVLCLHGTDNVVGHGTVVGLGNRPNRQYAAELAERGFVTLALNYPLLAKYQPDVMAMGWQSGTLKAVWDNKRGLDLLETLPFVRRGSFGAIGHSLGGHNAVYTALFDDRISAVVSSCGLDSFLDYYGGEERHWFPEKGWCQTRYMPRLVSYRGRLADIPFDFHELIGALAPRQTLIIAPKGDSNFQADSVDRVAAAARPVFKLLGYESRLQVEHPDCPHDFPPEMRVRAYKLFGEALK